MLSSIHRQHGKASALGRAGHGKATAGSAEDREVAANGIKACLRGCDMSEQSVLIDMAEYVAAKSVLARATMAHYGHALIPDDHMEPAFTQCMTSAHESWL